ncbi:hypothetical protein TWF569_000080 [Orbilia oligospora]|nr:hypothetical protein TWF569_000080 [Orbilia oligospora]
MRYLLQTAPTGTKQQGVQQLSPSVLKHATFSMKPDKIYCGLKICRYTSFSHQAVSEIDKNLNLSTSERYVTGASRTRLGL